MIDINKTKEAEEARREWLELITQRFNDDAKAAVKESRARKAKAKRKRKRSNQTSKHAT